MNKKELKINMMANIIAFAVNTVVSFLITTRIINLLGSEAQGFVSIGNNMANYATIVTVALNSMAARYIMVSLSRNKEDARKYYNSVIVANAVLSFVMVILSAIVVITCHMWLDISPEQVADVKINFVIVFLNFILNLLFSTTGQVYYLTNKLYIGSLRTMESTILKAVVIFVLFWWKGERIYFIAIGALCATVYLVVTNIYYMHKLLPDMKLSIKDYEWSKVRTLLGSGVWNSITRLSQVLSSECDTLISNIFISKAGMGMMAISKTIPNLIASFQVSLSSVFTPNLTELYAKDEKERLKETVKSSMRIMCVFTSIPNVILVATGLGFYSLWIPNEPIKIIYILSVITAINSVVTGILQPIYSIFTITNKVKKNSIAMMIYGVISVVITLILLKTTSLGVYAVAGVSQIGSIILAMVFHLPQGAKALKLPAMTFLPEIIISVISFVSLSIVGRVVVLLIPIQSWLTWVICSMIIGVVGIGLNIVLILNKEQRKTLINKFKRNK